MEHSKRCEWIVSGIHGASLNTRREETPNDPKLSDSGPGARMGARRREAKARAVPGFMAGSTPVTEPVGLKPRSVTERQSPEFAAAHG